MICPRLSERDKSKPNVWRLVVSSLFAFRSVHLSPTALDRRRGFYLCTEVLNDSLSLPTPWFSSKPGHHHDTVHQLDIVLPQGWLCWVQIPDIQLRRAQGQQTTRTKMGHVTTSVPVEGHTGMRSIWWILHLPLVFQPRWADIHRCTIWLKSKAGLKVTLKLSGRNAFSTIWLHLFSGRNCRYFSPHKRQRPAY